jgi:hypothetical protein
MSAQAAMLEVATIGRAGSMRSLGAPPIWRATVMGQNGVIIVRQRPGTAKGFFFIAPEDETGTLNLIVRPSLF